MSRPGALVVERVDLHDDAAVGEWYAVQAAAQRLGRAETATVWTLPELVVMLRDPSPRQTMIGLAGRDRGEVVGTATLTMSNVDNRDVADIEVDVRPDRRGEGFGAALLAAAEQVARDHDRTILHAEVAWPYDGGPDGADSPELGFARAHGFSLGIVDVQRHLALPVEAALLDRLGDEAAPHHTAYEIRAWCGPVPDDIVDGWAALTGTLMTEAPVGEMTREEEAIDAAAVREHEEQVRLQGRTKYNAAAIAPSGDVVAYSDIATTVHEPGKAYQWGTLVRRDHRGHRLGMALKVANLRQLIAARPDVVTIRTWNAEVNSHMVGVNVALGYLPVERLGELEKRLS